MQKINAFSAKLLSYFLITATFLFNHTVTAKDISYLTNDDNAITGRWDLTIYADGKQYPSWLEVQKSGYILVGRYVGIVGSARPVARINFSSNKLSFTVPPQWEGKEKRDLWFDGELAGDSLSGILVDANGKTFNWSGVRAPSLKRDHPPVWGQAIQLFNGKNLDGWHPSGKTNQWIVQDGILQSPHTGSNLISDRAFNDFKLHVEFRYPEGSNSGVYLRGRYEVQIEASHDDEPYKNIFSAIYGFIEPSELAAKKPGEWQTFDITLTGRMVTVIANGKTVICNREIPGITGGALDSHEGEPGPLYIQGDHLSIEYRNITITPAE
jgi:hypothetical protein